MVAPHFYAKIFGGMRKKQYFCSRLTNKYTDEGKKE
jgi:hypothetical protein